MSLLLRRLTPVTASELVYAVYPDRVRRPTLHASEHQSFAWVAAAISIAAGYPDQVRRPVLAVAEQQSFVGSERPVDPGVVLPERRGAGPFFRASEQQAFAFVPIEVAPEPAVLASTIFPDRLERPALSLANQQAAVVAPVPDRGPFVEIVNCSALKPGLAAYQQQALVLPQHDGFAEPVVPHHVGRPWMGAAQQQAFVLPDRPGHVDPVFQDSTARSSAPAPTSVVVLQDGPDLIDPVLPGVPARPLPTWIDQDTQAALAVADCSVSDTFLRPRVEFGVFEQLSFAAVFVPVAPPPPPPPPPPKPIPIPSPPRGGSAAGGGGGGGGAGYFWVQPPKPKPFDPFEPLAEYVDVDPSTIEVLDGFGFPTAPEPLTKPGERLVALSDVDAALRALFSSWKPAPKLEPGPVSIKDVAYLLSSYGKARTEPEPQRVEVPVYIDRPVYITVPVAGVEPAPIELGWYDDDPLPPPAPMVVRRPPVAVWIAIGVAAAGLVAAAIWALSRVDQKKPTKKTKRRRRRRRR